jgi:exodeoxyribonuclease V beta subunit
VEQQYVLQYHLYLLALDRLLRSRLPDYDYDRHIGGVVYVFVRGVTATDPELGLFRDRPARGTLEVLAERLLGPVPEEVL